MAKWTPGSNADEQSPEDRDPRNIPPGNYIIAQVRIGKRTTQRGTMRGNGKWRLLQVPPEVEQLQGKHVWMSYSLDVTNPGVARMLTKMCFGMGLTATDEFDPGKIEEVRKALLFRPMACQIKRTQDGQYINNDIGAIYPRDQLKQSTLDQMVVWERELRQEAEDDGYGQQQDPNGWDDGAPMPGDDDAPQGGGGRYKDLPF